MLPEAILKNIQILCCPICGGDFKLINQKSVNCSRCNQIFNSEAGILLAYQLEESSLPKKDITKKIKTFYEENPFPNYENLDSIESLREKAQKGIFTRLLDEQIPFGAKILEVGCGTGQLANFLAATWGRTVFGTDISLNSLKLGQEFKEKNHINNCGFFQMNLFKPVFKPESFDFVICNGVLHHTYDPFKGFETISKLVKKEGFIIIGLYNTYGRIPVYVRGFLFRIFSNRLIFLDPYLRQRNIGNLKKTNLVYGSI